MDGIMSRRLGFSERAVFAPIAEASGESYAHTDGPSLDME